MNDQIEDLESKLLSLTKSRGAVDADLKDSDDQLVEASAGWCHPMLYINNYNP